MVESLLDKRFLTTETIEKDWYINGTVDEKEVINYAYDASGNLTSETHEADRNGDGIVDSRSATKKTYNARGNLTSETHEDDGNGDGIIDSRSVITKIYDASGNLTLKISEDENGDGILKKRSVITKIYNASGNLTSETHASDGNGDGIVDSRSATMKTYDAGGNLTSETYEEDRNGDGIIDSRSTITNTYTYDASGNLISVISEDDGDGDGIANERSTTTKTYDASGKVTGKIFEKDDGANGRIDYRTVTTFTYNSNGQPTLELTKIDGDGDVPEGYRWTTSTYTYDANGNLTAETTAMGLVEFDERDEDSNVIPENRTIEVYDANGKLTSRTTENYLDYLVEPRNYQATTSYNYDSKGNLISKAFESNERGDIFSYHIHHSLETYAYDSSGQLTTKTSEIDFPGDWAYGHSTREIRASTYSTIFNGDSVPVAPPQIPAEVPTNVPLNPEEGVDNGSGVDNGTKEDFGIVDSVLVDVPQIPEDVPTKLPVSPEENTGIVDSVVLDLSQGSGYVVTKFTLSRESPLDNFLGFYKVTDKNGGIDVNSDQLADLVPGDPDYAQAVLNRYQRSIALTTRNGLTSVFVNELQGGSLYAPFLIAQGNPNSFSPDKIHFAFAAANADGLEHIKFDNGSLFCEDEIGGGDNDFNDAVISVQFLLDERLTLMNLTDLTGLAAVEFTLNREAAHDNFVGFYRVTDEKGGIDVDGDGVADLLPGDKGYTEAALASYEANVVLVTADGKTSVFVNELAGGTFYAPFLVADGQPTDPNSFDMEAVYFAFTAANADKVEHIKFQDGRLYCEDWTGGGDNDFNDAVVQIGF